MDYNQRAKNMIRSLFRTNKNGEALWRSDTLGWVDKISADTYTDEERALRRHLPVVILDDGMYVYGGEWWPRKLVRGRYRLDD